MTLARSEVPLAVRKIMYGLSKAKEKVLYHLYVIVTMSNGKRVMIEKNERINIGSKIPKPKQLMNIQDDFSGITINDLIYKTKSLLGAKKFYNYNSSTSNCQTFIVGLMQSNGLLTDERHAFIKQDTTDLFYENDSLRKFANTIVNEVAGRANILFHGGNISNENKIYTNGNTMTNPWISHVANFRKANPSLSYKQCLQEAKKTYTKKTSGQGVSHTCGDGFKSVTRKATKSVTKAVNREANPWITFVKKFASDNNLKYADALKQAGAHYKK